MGAFLLNHLRGPLWRVTYWRNANEEVDFVVTHSAHIWAVEVNSGRAGKTRGLRAFRRRYPNAQVWLVGDASLPLNDGVQVLASPKQPATKKLPIARHQSIAKFDTPNQWRQAPESS